MLIKTTRWIITDINEKVAAYGKPRNRYLHFVDSNPRAEIITYYSEAIAKSNFNKLWFYYGPEVDKYLLETYATVQEQRDRYPFSILLERVDEFMKPLKVEVVIESIRSN